MTSHSFARTMMFMGIMVAYVCVFGPSSAASHTLCVTLQLVSGLQETTSSSMDRRAQARPRSPRRLVKRRAQPSTLWFRVQFYLSTRVKASGSSTSSLTTRRKPSLASSFLTSWTLWYVFGIQLSGQRLWEGATKGSFALHEHNTLAMANQHSRQLLRHTLRRLRLRVEMRKMMVRCAWLCLEGARLAPPGFETLVCWFPPSGSRAAELCTLSWLGERTGMASCRAYGTSFKGAKHQFHALYHWLSLILTVAAVPSSNTPPAGRDPPPDFSASTEGSSRDNCRHQPHG
ncbi:unnamed protein product [Ectocarpus sp. 12 AP-2014]